MENMTKEKTEVTLLDKTHKSKPEIKAYKRRWIILSIYIYYACICSVQWIEYSSITPLVVKYYNVSTIAVDWTAIIYMAVYPFLVIPASYIIDKKGLRVAGLIGCIGTLVGTGVKVLSIRRDLFIVVLIGQCIMAVSQLVIVSLPPKIASIWFKPNEVSTSCALGVFGTQFGNAIGYILPSMLVKDHVNVEDIGSDFSILCWVLTVSMIPVTIAILVYFPKEPPLPPSLAQAHLREIKQPFQTSMFFLSLKELLMNKGFFIHMIAYGINVGVFSAIGTLLTQFILQHFEGANEDAGRMGFVMVIAGMVSSLVFGIILDKTHKYKETTLAIYFLTALTTVFLMYALDWKSKLLTYVACIAFGAFSNGYMPVGFELAIELTFPAEESNTTGIIIAMTQILGVIFTVVLGYLNLWFGCFWSLATQAGLMFLGTIITAFVPNNLRRQEAFKQNNQELKRRVSYHGSKLVFSE